MLAYIKTCVANRLGRVGATNIKSGNVVNKKCAEGAHIRSRMGLWEPHRNPL